VDVGKLEFLARGVIRVLGVQRSMCTCKTIDERSGRDVEANTGSAETVGAKKVGASSGRNQHIFDELQMNLARRAAENKWIVALEMRSDNTVTYAADILRNVKLGDVDEQVLGSKN
jgi:hypothetical protein